MILRACVPSRSLEAASRSLEGRERLVISACRGRSQRGQVGASPIQPLLVAELPTQLLPGRVERRGEAAVCDLSEVEVEVEMGERGEVEVEVGERRAAQGRQGRTQGES